MVFSSDFNLTKNKNPKDKFSRGSGEVPEVKNDPEELRKSQKDKINKPKYFSNLNYNEIVLDENNKESQNSLENYYNKQFKGNNRKESEERVPILVIDVNLDQNSSKEKKNILVYEGDTPEGLARSFSNENSIIFI